MYVREPIEKSSNGFRNLCGAWTGRTTLLERCGQSGTEVGWRFYGATSCGVHRGVFVFCGALPAGDDGSGVAHTAARGRGLSGDEADHLFFHIGFDPGGGSFFSVAADFADQNYSAGFGIVVEKFYGVQERSAGDGVATDADAGGLADTEARELVYRLVGESAAAADHTDVALLVDPAGHDADFTFAGRDY